MHIHQLYVDHDHHITDRKNTRDIVPNKQSQHKANHKIIKYTKSTRWTIYIFTSKAHYHM